MRYLSLALFLVACGSAPSSAEDPRIDEPRADSSIAPDVLGSDAAPTPITLTGAGDIAWCEPPGVGSGEVTAKLLDTINGPIFTAGDNSNGRGTSAEYERCFGPAWGRHLARIRPAPGNHDYTSAMADGADYHAYFGAAAGERGKGYYSYDLGAWHIIVLNSECGLVSCEADSEQERWLKDDLTAHASRCTMAIFHRPHFDSRTPSGNPATAALFADLYAAGVDLLISGHDHWYERFKPQDPSGAVDEANGVRQFIVGTGGAQPMTNLGPWVANSELHFENVFGVLKLTLHAERYDWEFVPEAGKTGSDVGSAACH